MRVDLPNYGAKVMQSNGSRPMKHAGDKKVTKI